jgi:hypothetical protein
MPRDAQITADIKACADRFDIATWKRADGEPGKGKMNVDCPIMISTQQHVMFPLRAEIAKVYDISNGVDIEASSVPYSGSGAKEARKDAKNNIALRKKPNLQTGSDTSFTKVQGSKAIFYVPITASGAQAAITPVSKTRTSKTADKVDPNQSGSSTGTYKEKRTYQRFPSIVSHAAIIYFIGSNCARLPLRVVINRKRYYTSGLIGKTLNIADYLNIAIKGDVLAPAATP